VSTVNIEGMKAVIIVSAHCEPLPTSAAAHMCDLAEKLQAERAVDYMTQTKFSLGRKSRFGTVFGFRNPFIKSQNHYLRLFGELVFPLLLAATFGLYLRTCLRNYDVVAYSPTALQFPLLTILKRKDQKQFLILRDIFPQWLADANILSDKTFSFKIFKKLSSFQYYLSNVIGVQAADDIALLDPKFRQKCIVLNSFYNQHPSHQKYEKIFNRDNIEIGCFGTFGKAQGWLRAIRILDQILLSYPNVNLSYYGSNNARLNIELFSENVRGQIQIHNALTGEKFSERIQEMDIGFFSLESGISRSNIPGKFVSYCKYGIPTFALCDAQSNVANLIRDHELGCVWDIRDEIGALDAFANFESNYEKLNKRKILDYFVQHHSTSMAINCINNALSSEKYGPKG